MVFRPLFFTRPMLLVSECCSPLAAEEDLPPPVARVLVHRILRQFQVRGYPVIVAHSSLPLNNSVFFVLPGADQPDAAAAQPMHSEQQQQSGQPGRARRRGVRCCSGG